MSVRQLQTNLGVVSDGALGPKTFAALLDRIGEPGERRTSLAAALAGHLAGYEINTRLRTVHFLAQAAHETDGFRYMKELGGPAYLARYDGRDDLGNTEPGDGLRFCGRGIFQITGRDNYRRYGDRLGLDLISAPHRASEPDTAVRIACLYWRGKDLSHWADADDVLAVSNGINRGNPRSEKKPNGLEDRQVKLQTLKGLWPA